MYWSMWKLRRLCSMCMWCYGLRMLKTNNNKLEIKKNKNQFFHLEMYIVHLQQLSLHLKSLLLCYIVISCFYAVNTTLISLQHLHKFVLAVLVALVSICSSNLRLLFINLTSDVHFVFTIPISSSVQSTPNKFVWP